MESGIPDEKIIVHGDRGSRRYVGLSRATWHRTPSAGAEGGSSIFEVLLALVDRYPGGYLEVF